MQNQITIFNFENSTVRTAVNANNEPYFCLADVADILAIKNSSDVANKQLDKKGCVKIEIIDSLNRKQQATFINEPNLYRVIFRSNKPEAEKFQNWVFEEVLPSIRKTGNYSQKTNAHQRQALVTACDKLAVGNTLRSDIYKMVGNQFGVDDVANIPMDKIPEAVAFVYEIILAKQHTPTTTQTNQKDQSHLTQADALILAKVLDYARLYADFAPKIQTPKGQEHITTLYCNNTSNEDDGFFICYRPNYKDDIEKAMTLFRNIAQNSLLPTA